MHSCKGRGSQVGERVARHKGEKDTRDFNLLLWVRDWRSIKPIAVMTEASVGRAQDRVSSRNGG